jgi:hypothetical protein
MRLVRLTRFYDFIQVLYNARNPPTKNLYFPMHILFTTIYLLSEQNLNLRNYYEQENNGEKFLYNLVTMMCTGMKSLEV